MGTDLNTYKNAQRMVFVLHRPNYKQKYKCVKIVINLNCVCVRVCGHAGVFAYLCVCTHIYVCMLMGVCVFVYTPTHRYMVQILAVIITFILN